TKAIGELGAQIGAASDYSTIPSLIARALADGLSLEGAGEALSIGAAVLYLRSQLGNPMDVHLHTGANNRRYLVRPGSGFSRRTQILGLMTWHTGPEVRNTQQTIALMPDPDRERVAALPHRDQGALLDALTESIYAQPRIDLRTVGNIGRLMAKPEVQNTVELAQQYANLGYDPEAYFVRLGEITCRDNFTEMHAFKHHQAAYEEYRNTRSEYRWLHLVAAAKAAAISYGKMVNIYEEVRELLPV
ncbi:MAG TPA: hypothetical protein VHL09_02530, partial [Dehalococcoidia bacterium]|nr:hypothetical protein [Dehalococcoidia bacterium]